MAKKKSKLSEETKNMSYKEIYGHLKKKNAKEKSRVKKSIEKQTKGYFKGPVIKESIPMKSK